MTELLGMKGEESSGVRFDDEAFQVCSEYRDLRNLWRAVVMQSLHDLRSKGVRRKERSARKKAKEWIDLNNQDFLDVCALAEFNPIKVMNVAISGAASQVRGVKFRS